MDNLLIYVVAIILAVSIIVAFIEGEAAAVRRDDEPLTFWTILCGGLGSLGALIAFATAE